MSENLVIVSSAEQACGRYELKLGEQHVPLKRPSLVTGTHLVWVVISKEPGSLQSVRVGFTSHRSDTLSDLNQREPMLAIKEKMTQFITAKWLFL